MSSIVDIVMTTYNQSQYVAQAIESVLAQKCSFEYRLLIRDDSSTDNTLSVCQFYQEQYPDKVFVYQSSNNEGLIRNYLELFSLVKAPYIAILEGDDYWIDEHKLQRHVDILTEDENIGLVHSAAYELRGEALSIETKPGLLSGDLYKRLLQNGNCIYPLTTLIRTKLIEQYMDKRYLLNNHLLTIDYFIWLEISKHSTIYYDNTATGVYRVISTSVSNSDSATKILNFYTTEVNIVSFFLSKYPTFDINIKNVYFNFTFATAWKLIDNGFIREAAKLSKSTGVSDKNSLSLFLVTHSSFYRNLCILKYNWTRAYHNKAHKNSH